MQSCVILIGDTFLINCVSNENVSMWVNHVIFLVGLVFSARIMGRPVIRCVTIEVVIGTTKIGGGIEHRSITLTWRKFARCHFIFTRVCHVFYDLTTDTSFLPINQTSTSGIAYQPVVYVAFDEDLSAKLFPQREVYGVVVCFVQWRSCRDGNIHIRVYVPIWSWRDCVRGCREIIVIEESIAPN